MAELASSASPAELCKTPLGTSYILVLVVPCSSTGPKAARPLAQAHSRPWAGLPSFYGMVLPDNIVIAARDGDLSTVQTWLESDATHDINDVAGADLPGDDVWSVKGRGLLHLAALCHGRQEGAGYDYGGLRRACDMVTYLVAHGADVNQRDAGGEPPLHLACGNALTSAVYELLQAGADPDGASTANAPLYWVFNGILQLADNKRGDRDIGEVLQDMCTCMVELLRAGAAIDFFHVAEGCGDPMRGLEDVILEVMYSPRARVENLPQRTFT